TLLGDNKGGDRVADNLPAGTTASGAVPATTPTVATTTTGTTATETTATATETTATEPTATTTTPSSSTDDAAAEAKRAARLKRKREAAAAAAAKKKGHTGVTVRVDASIRPTFLCVDNAHGTTMFSGTLSGKKVFRAKRIRMNIGLASTRVTVNGSAVRLDGSPTGFDITRKGGARSLALGKRPCG
ncbi:MAG: hypothetical protein JWQ18_1605, partial [Conexibacter sp.]|nr:hypothetical protein [Conexibacter sp.]